MEIERYNALAETWWDESGVMWPLHKLNACRVPFISHHIQAQGLALAENLSGLRILDIGCGAGLLSESMANLGAEVVGVDPAEKNIAIARAHARQSGLNIDYRVGTLETVEGEDPFDVVLNMEVVEHVEHLSQFLSGCCRVTRDGGLQFVATINRTLKSLIIAKFGAEYVVRWLPKGTHDWRKFVRPQELAGFLEQNSFNLLNTTGIKVNPLNKRFSLSQSTAINYMMVAKHDV